MMETVDEKQIVRFFLGELSEDARLQVEERMFRDDGFYEQVLAIQEELADDYVRNNLSAGQRIQFNNHFLRSPRRKARVKFAAAFNRALVGQAIGATPAASGSRWWESLLSFRLRLSSGPMLAALAAVLVMLIGFSWLYVDNRRLSKSVEQGRAERDKLIDRARGKETEADREKQRLESEIAALRARGNEMDAAIQQKERELDALKRASQSTTGASISEAATFILSPGLTRGADEPEKLMISRTSRLIHLELALEKPENYKGYVAEIRTARGNLVLSRSIPAAQQTSFGQAVSLTVPVHQLPIGEYEITLKGSSEGRLQSIGYYYFIALRR